MADLRLSTIILFSLFCYLFTICSRQCNIWIWIRIQTYKQIEISKLASVKRVVYYHLRPKSYQLYSAQLTYRNGISENKEKNSLHSTSYPLPAYSRLLLTGKFPTRTRSHGFTPGSVVLQQRSPLRLVTLPQSSTF